MTKNSILILVLLVVVIVGVVFLITKEQPVSEEEEFLPPIVQESERKGIVNVGYGWSKKDDLKSAIAEAVSKMQQGLKQQPDYVLVFSTVGYDSKELIQEIRDVLGPRVQIQGGTSCLAVITKEGWHQGDVGSLAILGVSSKEISFGVGGADLDESDSPKQAAKKAILEAIANAGKTPEESPKMVSLMAACGHEEEIILGIEEIIGKDVPIIGGSSGDNDLTGQWKEFVQDKVYSNGISLTAIYTDLNMSFAYEGGFLKTEQQGVITKAEGRTIYEIDKEPAAVVYNQWTGGAVSEELEKGGPVLNKTAFYPLAKILRGKQGEVHYLSIHPLSVNVPEKSLTVFTDVKQGEEILFMRGDWEILLNRIKDTSSKSLTKEDIKPQEVVFAIYRYCAGTMLAIPEEERPKIPLLLNQVLKGTPYIGAFTFGEQGYLSGIGNRHGNLINSIIIFTEDKK